MRRSPFALGLLTMACVGFVWSSTGQAEAAVVQAVAVQGAASPGNNANVDILVLVTDASTGDAITTLKQEDFTVIDHFGVPGQRCGFSKTITAFTNVGTGAYHISVATNTEKPPSGGCKWVAGDYLGQIIVGSAAVKGQAAFQFSVK
jgi:hypothetical protein